MYFVFSSHRWYIYGQCAEYWYYSHIRESRDYYEVADWHAELHFWIYHLCVFRSMYSSRWLYSILVLQFVLYKTERNQFLQFKCSNGLVHFGGTFNLLWTSIFVHKISILDSKKNIFRTKPRKKESLTTWYSRSWRIKFICSTFQYLEMLMHRLWGTQLTVCWLLAN